MKQFSEIVKAIDENKKDIEILPTGLKLIDEYLDGGFLKKELVVLGGGTGKGKSLFGGTIFYNIARKGYKCAYFSLEISNEMIVSRLIGSESNISPTRIMIKLLQEEEEKRKDKARSKMQVFEEFMYFFDSLYEYSAIEKEIKEGQYDFVVVDFIQNILTKEPDEYQRLSTIALNLQKLAKEAKTCILALSQLSNAIAKDKSHEVVEYKGSGSIGTVCDLGFFIEKSAELPLGSEQNISLRLRKNRRGVSGQSFDFSVTQPGGRIIDK